MEVCTNIKQKSTVANNAKDQHYPLDHKHANVTIAT
jgi:hypothetical protein